MVRAEICSKMTISNNSSSVSSRRSGSSGSSDSYSSTRTCDDLRHPRVRHLGVQRVAAVEPRRVEVLRGAVRSCNRRNSRSSSRGSSTFPTTPRVACGPGPYIYRERGIHFTMNSRDCFRNSQQRSLYSPSYRSAPRPAPRGRSRRTPAGTPHQQQGLLTEFAHGGRDGSWCILT